MDYPESLPQYVGFDPDLTQLPTPSDVEPAMALGDFQRRYANDAPSGFTWRQVRNLRARIRKLVRLQLVVNRFLVDGASRDELLAAATEVEAAA